MRLRCLASNYQSVELALLLYGRSPTAFHSGFHLRVPRQHGIVIVSVQALLVPLDKSWWSVSVRVRLGRDPDTVARRREHASASEYRSRLSTLADPSSNSVRQSWVDKR